MQFYIALMNQFYCMKRLSETRHSIGYAYNSVNCVSSGIYSNKVSIMCLSTIRFVNAFTEPFLLKRYTHLNGSVSNKETDFFHGLYKMETGRVSHSTCILVVVRKNDCNLFKIKLFFFQSGKLIHYLNLLLRLFHHSFTMKEF